jgi:hypothetical protein
VDNISFSHQTVHTTLFFQKKKEMSANDQKDFQTENSELTEKLNTLSHNFETLSDNHEKMQKEQRNFDFNNCRFKNCNKNLDKEKKLKKPRSEDDSGNRVFKCDLCNKEFNEKWTMYAHRKKHRMHKCDRCDKTFKHLGIMKKHVLIAHENVKLYCNFYNNLKTCPFGKECIILHEDSKFCKCDSICQRNFCMFKHNKHVVFQNNVECDELETQRYSDNADLEHEADNDIICE